MKDAFNPKDWGNEFQDFLDSAPIEPPHDLSLKITTRIRRDLNPSIGNVMTKLGGIHMVVGSLSLLICSQFGMGRGTFLMGPFMKFGDLACMAFCGALFLGLTTLIASMLLSFSELKRVRRLGYSPILGLGFVSLIVFFCFGADIAVGFAFVWLLGGWLAGILAMETGLKVKTLVPALR